MSAVEERQTEKRPLDKEENGEEEEEIVQKKAKVVIEVS